MQLESTVVTLCINNRVLPVTAVNPTSSSSEGRELGKRKWMLDEKKLMGERKDLRGLFIAS